MRTIKFRFHLPRFASEWDSARFVRKPRLLPRDPLRERLRRWRAVDLMGLTLVKGADPNPTRKRGRESNPRLRVGLLNQQSASSRY